MSLLYIPCTVCDRVSGRNQGIRNFDSTFVPSVVLEKINWNSYRTYTPPTAPRSYLLFDPDPNYRTLYTVYHTPLGRFSKLGLLDRPRGYQYRTMRLWKDLGEMLPTSTFWAPVALFEVWRYPAWKTDPGVCDMWHSPSYTVNFS